MCKDAKDQRKGGGGGGGQELMNYMYGLMHKKKRTAQTYSIVYRNVIVFYYYCSIDFRSKFTQNNSIQVHDGIA